MQNMDFYYDFSGQKFDHPLSVSMNSFSRNVFSRQSSLEISYVLKGNYEMMTTDFSQTLKENEMVVIAPDDIHLLRPVDSGVILTIHIDFSRMNDSMAGKFQNRFNTDVYSLDKNPKSYVRLKKWIQELVQELLNEEQNLYHLNAIMMEMMYVASQQIPFELPLHTEYHANYMKAIQYIDQHYREDITLSQVAQQLSFSLSYTSKLMKKYMGIPFVKYVAYVRVRASLENLLEGRESIEKIALDCGMPSSKAYAATFKELYGILPSVYRKQFQQNMKYSHSMPKQKMVLDQNQRELLQKLLHVESIVYEAENIKIIQDAHGLTLHVEDSQIQIEPTSNQEMKVKILFS